MKQNRPRYLTLSRIPIELVLTQTDHVIAQFIKILFDCYSQLEAGEPMEYQETDNQVLNIALREAIPELEIGYKNYLQKINARKGAGAAVSESHEEDNQRSIADKSAVNNRSDQINQIGSDNTGLYQSDRINQTTDKLIRNGYTREEINLVLSRTNPDKVTDMEKYVKKAIDAERAKKAEEERRKGKTVSAQLYEQRDYGSEEDPDEVLDILNRQRGGA